MASKTRFGNLGRVFKEGESELLIGIARLSVLFEDLRLELDALRAVQDKPEAERTSDDQYRVMYFLRRSLSTLIEFRGGLTTVRLTAEYKQASLTPMDDGYINRAEQFLQQHWDRLKELRNEFGGHLQLPGIRFATQHLSDVVGSVTWQRPTDDDPGGLSASSPDTSLLEQSAASLQPERTYVRNCRRPSRLSPRDSSTRRQRRRPSCTPSCGTDSDSSAGCSCRPDGQALAVLKFSRWSPQCPMMMRRRSRSG
jgi:hypothetical protein